MVVVQPTGTVTLLRGGLSTGTEPFWPVHATAVFQRVGGVRRSAPQDGLRCPSDRSSRELVPQTIGFLVGAKAIEYGERLLRARCGLHVLTPEPLGVA